ncbi:MAG: winged helix-turn-helix domain-containing protein [Candidatus Bathyarchaeia archaeon]|jgi:DNA-binding HxlR family transcriptional regulator
MGKKDSRGMGELQTKDKIHNRWKILHVIRDGEWHQYKDIKKETDLSPPILAKHLKELRRFIEKKEGEEDNRETYYKANSALMSAFFQMDLTNAEWEDIEEQFLKSKDLSFALEQLNTATNLNIIMALTNIKSKNFDIGNPEVVQLFFETFVFSPYEILVSKLVEASKKIIDDIDLNQVMKEFKTKGE